MSRDIVFSGVQPTGEIHLGNYLGAIKQFLNFQKECDSIFCIVDQHAITIFQDPNELKEILESLSPEKYESMLDGVKENFERVKKYIRPDDLLFENIVDRLRERG